MTSIDCAIMKDTFSIKKSLTLKAKRDAILQGIKRGEKAIKEGRVLTHEQAKQKLKKWF